MDTLHQRDSRAVTNRLLAGLRTGRWRPGAWARMLADATGESVGQALVRPRAVLEVTLLHALVIAAARRGRRRHAALWAGISWALAVTHLGMLGGRRCLGVANVLTLLRANLPALKPDAPRWLGALALATDLVDGRLARALGTTGRFGTYADSLADAAFWAWLARHDPHPGVRAAAPAAWIAPVLAVTIASFARGGMVETPRPELLRPAAAMQAVLTIRALTASQGERRR